MNPFVAPTDGFTLQLLQGGREFFPALIQAIKNARQRVLLETYIFDFAGIGAEVADALMGAAQRGVHVQLLIDGVGTGAVPPAWQARFEQAGVHYNVYAPLVGGWVGLRWLRLRNWRRLHRKLCVVDGQLLFCGGINVLDDMHDLLHGTLNQPRLDFAIAITGQVAVQAQKAMDSLWGRVQAMQRLRYRQLVQAWQAVCHRPRCVRVPHTRAKATLLLRDNVLYRHSIERAYRRAIGQAREEIIIANAYFLPGAKLRRALQAAAQRGVTVQLLLQGKYENFMQYHGARPVYASLLAAGVHIYEYTHSFLHAKVAVIDGQWVTVGSSNLDPLSLLLAREANVVIEDASFAKQLRECLQQAMHQQSHHLQLSSYNQRPWQQRVLDQLAYALMRLALWVTGYRY